MNTENTLQQDNSHAPAFPGGFDMKKILDMLIAKANADRMVPAGTAIESWDHDPKKRMIVIKAFDRSIVNLECMMFSGYALLGNQLNPRESMRYIPAALRPKKEVTVAANGDEPETTVEVAETQPLFIMPLGPVFHNVMLQFLRDRGLIADMQPGLAYLQSTLSDAPALSPEQALEAPGVRDAATVPSEAERESVALDIEADFANHRA